MASLASTIDVMQVRTAYGRRALQKLNEELSAADPKALLVSIYALSDIVHSPENVAACINIGMVGKLTGILAHQDDSVRESVTKVLHTISGHAVGRRAFTKNGTIDPLVNLVRVRGSTYSVRPCNNYSCAPEVKMEKKKELTRTQT